MTEETLTENGNAADTAATTADNQPVVNVWLVDDNQRLRETLIEIIDHCEGIRCTGAFPSPNAVLSALASKTGPDVILLDINMGGVNGLDAIRPIKTLSRSTQILMFTTFLDTDQKKRAMTEGASGFLLKRFSLDQIVDSIQEAKRNPVPHLRRSRSETPAAAAPAEEPKISLRPEPRFKWFRQCLGLMQHQHN
jgi:DNA-binding NarL/FixJ family response regulator